MAHPVVTKPHPVGSTCSLVIHGVLAYFFYTYGFANPDNTACWSDVNGFYLPALVDQGDYINVTPRFLLWFKVGFFVECFGLLYPLIGFLFHTTNI